MAKSHYEIWMDTFKPQNNHLRQTEAFDGCLFETYGPELSYVRSVAQADPARVWTIVESDSGKWYISHGLHLVNRVGYLVTERPVDCNNPSHVKRYLKKDTFYI